VSWCRSSGLRGRSDGVSVRRIILITQKRRHWFCIFRTMYCPERPVSVFRTAAVNSAQRGRIPNGWQHYCQHRRNCSVSFWRGGWYFLGQNLALYSAFCSRLQRKNVPVSWGLIPPNHIENWLSQKVAVKF